jgi:GlpG protein
MSDLKKKRVRIVFNAPVVLSFALICLVVTALGTASGGAVTMRYFASYRAPLLSPLTWFRAFSHVFGHSGWQHFLGNISMILLLGPMLEEKYGSGRLATAMAITALVTSIVNAVFFPGTGIMGASGIVFAFILLTSFTEFKEGEIPLSFILVALIYVGKELMAGILSADNISQLSHIIGGACGASFGYAWNRKSRS